MRDRLPQLVAFSYIHDHTIKPMYRSCRNRWHKIRASSYVDASYCISKNTVIVERIDETDGKPYAYKIRCAVCGKNAYPMAQEHCTKRPLKVGDIVTWDYLYKRHVYSGVWI